MLKTEGVWHLFTIENDDSTYDVPLPTAIHWGDRYSYGKAYDRT